MIHLKLLTSKLYVPDSNKKVNIYCCKFNALNFYCCRSTSGMNIKYCFNSFHYSLNSWFVLFVFKYCDYYARFVVPLYLSTSLRFRFPLVSLLRRLKPKNKGPSQLELDTGSYLNRELHSFALYRHFNDTNSEIGWYNIYRHLYCNDRKNTFKDFVNFAKSVP